MGAPLDIDMLAASLRADSTDTGAFVEGLAAKMSDVLPGRVTVERRRAGMFGPKFVRRIAVDAGDRRLELICSQHTVLEACRARLSGGIVLKSEQLEVDEWLGALTEALAAEAERSEKTRQALERLLIN